MDATEIISLESLINTTHTRLDLLTRQLHEVQQSLQSIFDNNDEFLKITEDCDKLSVQKRQIRQKVLSLPSAAPTVAKLKDLQAETREIKRALSDYLTRYVTLSGQHQFETSDGTLMEISYSAKLVRTKG